MATGIGLPLDASSVLDLPPSVVLYGPPGVGKSFEMARAFPRVLYVQSSPSILHALAHYATTHPEIRVPDRVTLDEKVVAQHFAGSYTAAILAVVEKFVAACDAGTCPYEGIVFDEWNTLSERIFAELKTDPWGKFKGRSGSINIFAVMDAFKTIHRSVLSLARRTRKVVGFVSHFQIPKLDEDENSPTKGAIKWQGGPKMPMGLSDQVVEICAEADVVLQLMMKESKSGDLMSGTASTTAQRVFLTQLDPKWFRKVRGFGVEPEEVLDVKQGKGLRELLVRAGYPV
jgi:hypothetical protein